MLRSGDGAIRALLAKSGYLLGQRKHGVSYRSRRPNLTIAARVVGYRLEVIQERPSGS